MSCWVVPSIAAELWRVPLAQVLNAVAERLVPMREEYGFTFIDVAPHGPRLMPKSVRTWTAAEEIDLPVAAMPVTQSDPFAPPVPEPVMEAPIPEDEAGPIGEASENISAAQWEAARATVGRRRQGPLRRAA